MLELPDEYRHVQDINRFQLESVCTPKVQIQVLTYTHSRHTSTPTSLLKDFPLGLIRLTLFHKLTDDHLQKKTLQASV